MTKAYNPGSRFTKRSSYGPRTDPMTGTQGAFHSGLDFAAPAGTPIPTATSGKVVYSGYNEMLGNVVIVQNDTGEYSLSIAGGTGFVIFLIAFSAFVLLIRAAV